MLGGVTRMTISLTIILMETTNDIQVRLTALTWSTRAMYCGRMAHLLTIFAVSIANNVGHYGF